MKAGDCCRGTICSSAWYSSSVLRLVPPHLDCFLNVVHLCLVCIPTSFDQLTSGRWSVGLPWAWEAVITHRVRVKKSSSVIKHAAFAITENLILATLDNACAMAVACHRFRSVLFHYSRRTHMAQARPDQSNLNWHWEGDECFTYAFWVDVSFLTFSELLLNLARLSSYSKTSLMQMQQQLSCPRVEDNRRR